MPGKMQICILKETELSVGDFLCWNFKFPLKNLMQFSLYRPPSELLGNFTEPSPYAGVFTSPGGPDGTIFLGIKTNQTSSCLGLRSWNRPCRVVGWDHKGKHRRNKPHLENLKSYRQSSLQTGKRKRRNHPCFFHCRSIVILCCCGHEERHHSLLKCSQYPDVLNSLRSHFVLRHNGQEDWVSVFPHLFPPPRRKLTTLALC